MPCPMSKNQDLAADVLWSVEYIEKLSSGDQDQSSLAHAAHCGGGSVTRAIEFMN